MIKGNKGSEILFKRLVVARVNIRVSRYLWLLKKKDHESNFVLAILICWHV